MEQEPTSLRHLIVIRAFTRTGVHPQVKRTDAPRRADDDGAFHGQKMCTWHIGSTRVPLASDQINKLGRRSRGPAWDGIIESAVDMKKCGEVLIGVGERDQLAVPLKGVSVEYRPLRRVQPEIVRHSIGLKGTVGLGVVVWRRSVSREVPGIFCGILFVYP